MVPVVFSPTRRLRRGFVDAADTVAVSDKRRATAVRKNMVAVRGYLVGLCVCARQESDCFPFLLLLWQDRVELPQGFSFLHGTACSVPFCFALLARGRWYSFNGGNNTIQLFWSVARTPLPHGDSFSLEPMSASSLVLWSLL